MFLEFAIIETQTLNHTIKSSPTVYVRVKFAGIASTVLL